MGQGRAANNTLSVDALIASAFTRPPLSTDGKRPRTDAAAGATNLGRSTSAALAGVRSRRARRPLMSALIQLARVFRVSRGFSLTLAALPKYVASVRRENGGGVQQPSAAVLTAIYVLAVAWLLATVGCQATHVGDAPAIDRAAGTGLQIGDHFDSIIHHAGAIK